MRFAQLRDRSAARCRARPSRRSPPAAQTKPVTPSSMISGRPPTCEATTGTSHAIASSAARPKLSCADGSRNRSATDSHGTRSCCSPTNVDVVGEPVLGDAAARRSARSGPSPIEHEPGAARVWRISAKHLERRVDALDRPEVRDVDDERVVSSGGHSRARSAGSGRRRYSRAVEEVRDDADLVADAERRDRVAPSGCRDTAVTPCDCSIENATDARVRRIAADQRDVGAVQRRDRARRGAPGADAEHLIGEIRGGRVRHGVVRVDDVEPLLARDARRSCWRAPAGTAARGTADTAARRRARTTSPARPSRQRNGGSLLIRCTSWPRRASACASSVATTPLPPTDA